MKDATPADKLAPPAAGRGTGERAPMAPPQRLVEPAQAPEQNTGPFGGTDRVTASIAVGKVFFHDPADGKDYVCSGSVVNGPAKNLVSTAGHCVHGGKGGAWMQNWSFVPYYDHDNRPYGTWSAHYLTTFRGWTDDGNYDWDIAFVNVWPNNGGKLVDAVGGNGLSVNYPKQVDVTLLAYPVVPPFDGQSQYSCEGRTYEHGAKQIGFDCLLTGGASGGPFLLNYDGRYGYVNGVISNGPNDKNFSPYFDDTVANLYNAVKNRD